MASAKLNLLLAGVLAVSALEAAPARKQGPTIEVVFAVDTTGSILAEEARKQAEKGKGDAFDVQVAALIQKQGKKKGLQY